MMARFGSKLLMDAETGRTFFQCPGCNRQHLLIVKGVDPWGWNESGDAPTFTPSVLVRGTLPLSDSAHAAWMCKKAPLPPPIPFVCHSFVTDGRIQFLDDCTHSLAGQTVDLPDWPDRQEPT